MSKYDRHAWDAKICEAIKIDADPKLTATERLERKAALWDEADAIKRLYDTGERRRKDETK